MTYTLFSRLGDLLQNWGQVVQIVIFLATKSAPKCSWPSSSLNVATSTRPSLMEWSRLLGMSVPVLNVWLVKQFAHDVGQAVDIYLFIVMSAKGLLWCSIGTGIKLLSGETCHLHTLQRRGSGCRLVAFKALISVLLPFIILLWCARFNNAWINMTNAAVDLVVFRWIRNQPLRNED